MSSRRNNDQSQPSTAIPAPASASDSMGAPAGASPYAQDLDLLRNVCGVLAERDLDRVLGLAMEAIVALSGAERAMLVRRDTAGGGLSPALRRGAPDERVSRSVIERALSTRQPVVIPNALEDPDFSDQQSVKTMRLLSVLAVPLVAGGAPVAAVYADSTRATGIFAPALAERLAGFANRIAPAVEAALAAESLRSARTALRRELDQGGGFGEIAGESPRFLQLLEDVARVAPTDATVLLIGESGTGKELLARALHDRSRRARGPFVPVNCAALPEALLESELFGHRKGSFTGAVAERRGRMLTARGGTLFLDEIGEVPLPVQAKLLRALERREIQPVGADEVVEVDLRFVAATHRDLAELVGEGRFREDLYFRLRVATLAIPPLRDRPEDLLPLARRFVEDAGRRHGRQLRGLGSDAEGALLAYAFPGNVRELRHAVEHAVIFARGEVITAADLPEEVRREAAAGQASERPRTKSELDLAKERAALDLERAFVRDALARAGGRVADAARHTGMNRSVLHQLMKKHGLDARGFRR